MEPLKLIFMGTPEFAVPTLASLMYSAHEVCAVYTQPPRPAHRGKKETPSPVYRLASAHGVPVFTPTSLKPMEIQREFAAHGADAAVVAAYGLLLPGAILRACRFGCINIHPSRLPRWRGAAPIQRTVMAGDQDTALCIMQMDEGLDTGDVLMQADYPVPQDMTAGELHDLLAHEAGPLTLRVLEALGEGTASRTPQPADGVTYAKKISKEEARIDWDQPAARICAQVHGLSPAPGAYFEYHGERIKLLRAAWEDAPRAVGASPLPGTTVDAALTVQCGHGVLLPVTVQRPGKNPMPVEEMLRGYPVPPGTSLV